jgi:quercetin dioxygenase-like cupin family protein
MLRFPRLMAVLPPMALLLLGACVQALPPEPPKAIVAEIFRGNSTALGQPLRFPRQNGTLVVTTYEIPAGARLPVHRHPQQRVAYVLAGQLRVSTPGGQGWNYKPGDVVVEMLDSWHSGETVGSETVRLLVIDQTEGNTPNTELHP